MKGLYFGKNVKYRGYVNGLRISSVDDTAFIDGANASVTALADGNHLIEIYDSSNRMLKGVLKAAGAGETLSGTEVVLNPDFQLGDAAFGKDAGWTIADIGAGDYEAVATNAGLGGSIYQDISTRVSTTGELYKGQAICSNFTDGSAAVFLRTAGDNGSILTGAGTSVLYKNAITGAWYTGVQILTAGTDLRISLISVKQVTAPSTSGATIVDAKGGTVYHFSYKHPDFVLNEATNFVIIKKLR